jgi:hypothetical protein
MVVDALPAAHFNVVTGEARSSAQPPFGMRG